jgi:hypothetical protein
MEMLWVMDDDWRLPHGARRRRELGHAVWRVLHELLPLDDERRAENGVWLAFTARALIDSQLRAQHNEVHDALHQACGSALETPAAHGPAYARATALQAERLHALMTGSPCTQLYGPT